MADGRRAPESEEERARFAALMAEIRGIVSTLDGAYRYYISGSIPFAERTGVYLSRDRPGTSGGCLA